MAATFADLFYLRSPANVRQEGRKRILAVDLEPCGLQQRESLLVVDHLAEERDADNPALAEQLADCIADICLFLEVESRTAAEIGGLLGRSMGPVLAALALLVEG